MGVGYTTIMWDEDSLTNAISDIAACQYDGVEMGLGTVEAVGVDSLQKQLDAAGLDLYCVMGEWLESQETADRIAESAASVAELGAPFLGILPPHRNLVKDAEFEEWLDQVCTAASNAGLTPILHHHGGTKVERPDETATWLDRGPETLELLWDSAHHYPYGEHYPGGDVTDGIERFADDIAYVHLKDVAPGSNFDQHLNALSAGEFKLDTVFQYYDAFTDLGDGIIDFAGICDVLSDADYDGHVTIEIEKQMTDPLVHAKRNLDYWVDATDETKRLST
jgi:inosose dehydratase